MPQLLAGLEPVAGLLEEGHRRARLGRQRLHFRPILRLVPFQRSAEGVQPVGRQLSGRFGRRPPRCGRRAQPLRQPFQQALRNDPARVPLAVPRHLPQRPLVPLPYRSQVQPALDAAVNHRFQGGWQAVRQTAVERLAEHQGVAMAAQDALVGRCLFNGRRHRGDGIGGGRGLAVIVSGVGQDTVGDGLAVYPGRQAVAGHRGVAERPGCGLPGQAVAVGGGAQQDVLAHLVGAAPEQDAPLARRAAVAEGEDPDGVVAVAAAQDADDVGQPILVVDPGGGARRVQFDLTGRHVPLADGRREEVVAPAGEGGA